MKIIGHEKINPKRDGLKVFVNDTWGSFERDGVFNKYNMTIFKSGKRLVYEHEYTHGPRAGDVDVFEVTE